MIKDNLLYRGIVNIYLQGQNALQPLSLCDHQLISAIGSENTDLIIHDHRGKIIDLLEASPPETNPTGFAYLFNQIARVEIRYLHERQGLDIDLNDADQEDFPEYGEKPILWMGISENNLIPAYEVEWEIYKSLDDKTTAFCALIPAQS